MEPTTIIMSSTTHGEEKTSPGISYPQISFPSSVSIPNTKFFPIEDVPLIQESYVAATKMLS